MEKIIQQILSELYGIDPSLHVHEEKIIKIINEYREAKPDTKFDAEFASRLKKEILQRVAELKAGDLKKSTFPIFGLSLGTRVRSE